MDSKRNLLQNLGELEVYLLLQNAKLLQYFDAFINHGKCKYYTLSNILSINIPYNSSYVKIIFEIISAIET